MQVLPQDVDSQHGIAQSPIGPSPSQSPLAFQPFGSAPSGPPSAYTSALARSTSASGNGNMSKLNRSSSGSTATVNRSPAATAATAENHDAASAVDVRRGSLGERQQATGATPWSEDGAVADNTPQTDTLQDSTEGAEQSSETTSSSKSEESGSASLPGSVSSVHQAPSAQIEGEAAGAEVLQPSTDQSPTDTQDSAQQAPAPARGQAADEPQDAASQAADESQDAASSAAGDSQHAAGPAADEPQAAADAAPSKTELQQSMNAVLSGEDQAMQESMAAANAAGGEQLKDLFPSPSKKDDPLAQADHQSPTHPTLTQASSALGPPSGPLQGAAASSSDALLGPAAVSRVAADKAAADVTAAAKVTSSEASSPEQARQLQQAEAERSEGAETGAEASDSTAAGQTNSSGQIAERFRSGSD